MMPVSGGKIFSLSKIGAESVRQIHIQQREIKIHRRDELAGRLQRLRARDFGTQPLQLRRDSPTQHHVIFQQ